MRRVLLLAAPLALVTLLAGCWIFAEPFDDCDEWFWDDCDGLSDCGGFDGGSDGSSPSLPAGMACVPGERRYCDTPTYCSWGEQVCDNQGAGWGPCHETSAPPGCHGFTYDQDCCIGAGACCQDWYDLDNDGDWNDSVGNCEEIPVCHEDGDCADGYCLAEEGSAGLCQPTGPCAADEECDRFGPGFGCDDRGLCAPTESPCPSGECGCEDDEECGEGRLCLGSLCADPATVCFFDIECGAGARCLNNECRAACETECAAGQACLSGVCIDPAVGADGCVFDEDCAAEGQVCINAACLPACAEDAECGAGQACQSGACRPDTAPERTCGAEAGCPADMTCHRGACRLPCVAAINCNGEMSECGEGGFCLAPAELSPECTREADCENGQACLSNVCMALN